MKLSHIGIAVPNLDDAVKVFSVLADAKPAAIKEVADQKVKVAMFPFEGGGAIELLMPTDESSPIKGFLDKKGQGLHHLAFHVDNIEQTLEDLKAKGYRLIDETPRIGASGCKIAFVHPKSTSGVLVELEEETE
ncbi:MAG: methylmalonyl-CoA epimerase [candidate division Zixibacteria bacterium]|nr:methylmalonyl-CoA epimerase [candidate division Zixibacteria bacterium]